MEIANKSNKSNKLLFPCHVDGHLECHIILHFFFKCEGWFSSCTWVSISDQIPDFQINHGFNFMGFACFGVLTYTNLFLWLLMM